MGQKERKKETAMKNSFFSNKTGDSSSVLSFTLDLD